MSIRARCRCGKKFQVKDSSAGKKFKCTECSAVVKVPEPEVDELEDFEDEEELDDGELKLPVRRKKKRPSKALTMTQGILWESAKSTPMIILRIFGLLNGIPGIFISVAYFVMSLISLCTLNILMFLIFLACGMLGFIGSKAACGYGMKASADVIWTGPASIIVGIILANLAVLIPAIAMRVMFMHN